LERDIVFHPLFFYFILFTLVSLAFIGIMESRGREKFIGRMSILNLIYLILLVIAVFFGILIKRKPFKESPKYLWVWRLKYLAEPIYKNRSADSSISIPCYGASIGRASG